MEGTISSPSEDHSFLLQAVRKRLFRTAFLDPKNNDERLNKNESKTKTVSVLSSKEGTEIYGAPGMTWSKKILIVATIYSVRMKYYFVAMK